MSVETLIFEIIGEGIALADQFEEDKKTARTAHWAFVEEVVGCGYRPESFGGLRSVLFDDQLPKGWRQIGRHQGRLEAVPMKVTKIGKALAKQITALPQLPQAHELAKHFGYNPSSFPMADGRIYFATEVRVEFPSTRHFLRLPFDSKDTFEFDTAVLQHVRESDFMRAVEDHNEKARRQREAGGDK